MEPTRIDQFIEENGVVTLPSATSSAAMGSPPLPPLGACPIKCMVFLAESSPVLVILRLEDRVSEAALARYLGLTKSRIAMAPPNQLINLTGYPVGEVPPFAHRDPLFTIVDAFVMSHSQVAFGHQLEYLLESTELVKASKAQVAAVSVNATEAAAGAEDGRNGGNGANLLLGNNGGDNYNILSNYKATDLPLPWVKGTETVTMTGIVAKKRKIANLLLFLNIVPTSAGALPRVSMAQISSTFV